MYRIQEDTWPTQVTMSDAKNSSSWIIGPVSLAPGMSFERNSQQNQGRIWQVNHQSTIYERELSYSAPKQHAKYWEVSVCHQCIQPHQWPSKMKEIAYEVNERKMHTWHAEHFQRGNINVAWRMYEIRACLVLSNNFYFFNIFSFSPSCWSQDIQVFNWARRSLKNH